MALQENESLSTDELTQIVRTSCELPQDRVQLIVIAITKMECEKIDKQILYK